MTRHWFSWCVLDTLRHCCMHCIMTSFATTVGSHKNTPNIQFSYMYKVFFVWNDDNFRNSDFYHRQTISIMYIKLFTTRKTWTFAIYLCHIYNVSSLSEPTVFWARSRPLLHVQSVRNKHSEYKYELTAILTILMITSKRIIQFRPNYAKI